ncbi:hypothetical protein M2146_002510 [Lachnospiraceae bacterium PF1-22]
MIARGVGMLTLPIKQKWFDMILSGVKKEEYREIKPYYTSRFKNLYKAPMNTWKSSSKQIMFRNGYAQNSPAFIAECTIKIGFGKEEWGAEEKVKYYIINIEKIVWKSQDDLKQYIQSQYITGDLIYPGQISRLKGVYIKEVYKTLAAMETEGLVKSCYELVCNQCKCTSGLVYRNIDEIPLKYTCNNCNHKGLGIEDAIVIYREK